jgi:serine/threonine protein kinase
MCNHPNIVKLKSAYEFKDECWMVFEYLEGGTLTEARLGHEFQENEIAYVAREVILH